VTNEKRKAMKLKKIPDPQTISKKEKLNQQSREKPLKRRDRRETMPSEEQTKTVRTDFS